MYSKSREVAIRPIAWFTGIIVTIVTVFFITFISLFSPGGDLWPLTSEAWSSDWQGTVIFALFWPLLVSSFASMFRGTKLFRKEEIALITSMLWIVWIIPTGYGIMRVPLMLGTTRQIPAFHKWNLDWGRNVMWQWGPDPFNDKLWESWMYGGPVPWSEWTVPILWNTLRLLSYYLMFVFMATLWRRQWVDIEALPFPYATAAAKLIDMAYEKVNGRTKLFDNIWLWLGLLVGFLAQYPYWAWVIPGLGLTPLTYAYSIGIDLTPYVIIPNAPLNFNVEAYLIGAAFLVPIKTLFSYIVTAIIVHWIWWPIMTYMGLWESHSAGAVGAGHGLACVIWRGELGKGPMYAKWVWTWGAPQWLSIGAMFGLMFYPVFVAFRSEFINGVKALIGRAPPEVEVREPMKYRYILLGFIVFATLYVVTWWYASEGNLPILYGYIYMVLFSLFWMGRARAGAEYGLSIDMYNDNYWAPGLSCTLREWWVADPLSPFFIEDPKSRFLVLRADYPWWWSPVARGTPSLTLIEAYKIGSIEGLHSKYVFLGGILATIIGIAVGLPVIVWMWHSFGALNLSVFNYTGAPNNYVQRGPTYACTATYVAYWRAWGPPTYGQWILFAIGFAITSIVYVMHARYPWFPVNPAGVTMGLGWMYYNVLIPSIIAYVAKLIVMRIGGARLYEDIALPFAIGMTASISLAILLTATHYAATTIAIM